jgi:hypothetical protein
MFKALNKLKDFLTIVTNNVACKHEADRMIQSGMDWYADTMKEVDILRDENKLLKEDNHRLQEQNRSLTRKVLSLVSKKARPSVAENSERDPDPLLGMPEEVAARYRSMAREHFGDDNFCFVEDKEAGLLVAVRIEPRGTCDD